MPVPTVVHLTAHVAPRHRVRRHRTTATELAGPDHCRAAGPRTAPSSSSAAAQEWKQRRWVQDSVRVPWPFEPLSPGEDASLRVRVSGSGDTVSDWSEPLRIRAGFLEPGGWAATPIGLAEPSEEAQPGLARTEFEHRR